MKRAARHGSPFQHLPSAVVVTQQGRIVDWSDVFETLAQRSADELLGTPLSDLLQDLSESPGETLTTLKCPQASLSVRVRASAEHDARRLYAVDAIPLQDRVYRAAFEHSSLGMSHSDLSGRFVMVNERFADMLGYTREQMLGMRFRDVTHPDDLGPSLSVADALRAAGAERVALEKRYLHKSGRVVQALVTVTLECDESGRPSYLTAIIQDVTPRREAETAQRRALSQLVEAERLAGIGSWDLDITTWQIKWSEQFFRICEFEPAAFGVPYEVFLQRVHPEDRERVDRVFQASLLELGHMSLTHRLLMPDGRVKWIQAEGDTLTAESGKGLRSVGTVQDITERRSTELGLRDRERRLSTILAAMEDIVILFQLHDRRLSIIEINPAGLLRLQRLQPSLTSERIINTNLEALGEALQRVLPEVGELNAALKYVFETGENVVRELEVRPRPGLVINSEVTFLPVPHGPGLPPLVLVVCRDFTERKKSEVLLRRSLAEKETLLAEVHHRVKNNLQLISSMLSLQGAEGVDARTSALLAQAQLRIQTMALMHQQLYRSNEFAAVSLDQHVQALATMVAQSSGTRRQGVVVRCDVGPAKVSLDHAIPLGLLINELISNAYKHAFRGRDTGEVLVSCHRKGDVVTLAVRDDGCGLPADFQLGTARTLGLRLVGALVAQLRAELRIEGGGGTCFTLHVPVPKEMS